MFLLNSPEPTGMTFSGLVRTMGYTFVALAITIVTTSLWILNKPSSKELYKRLEMKNQCVMNLRELGGAIDRYHKKNAEYPPTLADLWPKFLQEKAMLRCPVDKKEGLVSYEYMRPSEDDPAFTVIARCRRHILLNRRPANVLCLTKQGIVVTETAREGRTQILGRPARTEGRR